jgi:hypothetical protein
MSEPLGPTHYRFRTSYFDGGICVEEERWTVVKETEAGYWIVPEYMATWPGAHNKHNQKFVLKQSRRRYAYPDRQEAWNSFCIRRRLYQRRLELRAKANEVLVGMLPYTVPERPVPLERGIFALCSADEVVRATIDDEWLGNITEPAIAI